MVQEACVGESSEPRIQHARPLQVGWQAVDRTLRAIAKRRAALDLEEAHWLREAERLQIWRPLGMVSALDYLERVLCYAPHTAKERLRVARALKDLPALSAALGTGDLAYSAIRELTRVATPSTETRWRDVALGKNLRQLEELVANHKPGDDPDDPPDLNARTHVVRLELEADVFARLRQVRAMLGKQRGGYVDDNALVRTLCDAVLERGSDTVEPNGRAKFQIAMTVCKSCDRAWQEGGGLQVPVDAAALERARCDAQNIGSIDGDMPERASQDIPPSIVRFVWRRDQGRCQTPGCRSCIGLEIHHLIPRALGGTHDPSNLRLLCSSCHAAIHNGTLKLTLTADGLVAERPLEVGANDEAARLLAERLQGEAAAQDGADADAQHTLVHLGWKATVARAAVNEARSHVGPDVEVVDLVREALRRCPKPNST